MKIVFLSNYYNHHQHELSQALYRHTGGDYHFIATAPMPQERRELGYGQWDTPEYVHLAYTGEEACQACHKLVDEADVLIAGSAPNGMFHRRIAQGKLVFRYAERPLKQKKISLRSYLHFWRIRLTCGPKRNVFLLCAGGYTAGDYGKFGCFRGRAYKWGYFPETKCYEDLDGLLDGKDKTAILWAGRFLDWKHPELGLQVAKRLKDEGYCFTLRIIGTGESAHELEAYIVRNGLQEHVHLLGAMKPEQVREYMEKSGIYLFTSDRQEGWGAVLNESMNSGCAVVVSHAIGAVPFLIKDGENGLVYRSEDEEALYQRVKYLLDHPEVQNRLGKGAYQTITGSWNAEVAARRLVNLAEGLLSGEKMPKPYPEGPCSVAEEIDEDGYDREK